MTRYPDYGKCSKISNTFLFLFSNKMLVFWAGIHKVLVRIGKREYPDQATSEEVCPVNICIYTFLAGNMYLYVYI